jgi:hypothetical protein
MRQKTPRRLWQVVALEEPEAPPHTGSAVQHRALFNERGFHGQAVTHDVDDDSPVQPGAFGMVCILV